MSNNGKDLPYEIVGILLYTNMAGKATQTRDAPVVVSQPLVTRGRGGACPSRMNQGKAKAATGRASHGPYGAAQDNVCLELGTIDF